MDEEVYAINDKPMTSEESILTAFDAGSVSILDLVMETLGSIRNDELFELMHDFRSDILKRMNDRVPGSGDIIAALADDVMAEKLDFGD